MIQNKGTTTGTTSPELDRRLDYQPNDIIQIKSDGLPHAGRVGKILRVRSTCGKYLSYDIMLSDTESVSVTPFRIRLVRSADSDREDDGEPSKFWP